MSAANVAAALRLRAEPEQIAGFLALHAEFTRAVPAEYLPPDSGCAVAELCAHPDRWIVVDRPGFRYAIARGPFTATAAPAVVSVDLGTLTSDSSAAYRSLLPPYVVTRLVELGHDYRLWSALPQGRC